jgi:histone deacetylase 1/2
LAIAGAPVSNDDLIDYIITGLGKAFNAIAGHLTMGNRSVPYAEFYSGILSFDSMQAQQAQDDEWTSAAHAASRAGSYSNNSRPRAQDYSPVQSGGGRPSGNSYQQGQGRTDQQQSGGYGNGGNQQQSARRGKKQRPQCQLCGYWGHDAFDCKNRFNQDFVRNNNSRRSGNAASTTSNNSLPPWLMDSGATDHITNDLERLHVHERYTGKDNVQVANGKGLSISHIGHSTLAGSSIHLKNILHVPEISQHLLSVYRLVADNLVLVEFHRDFFFVKDKATRRILLHGRSKGGLYPVPVNRASASFSSRHASSSVKVSPSQ